jgi:transposase
MDGVHPSHEVKFTKGWIKKGKRVEIPTNSGHKRLNILGALNLAEMKVDYKEYQTLNADSTLDFLQHLLTTAGTGILHIILDQGRYQKCKAVEAFVAANQRIQLHYLPPYSPNLNVIERLWKLMHEHTTKNFYHSHFKDFSEKIHEFFNVTFPANAQKWTDTLTDHFRTLQSPLKTT